MLTISVTNLSLHKVSTFTIGFFSLFGLVSSANAAIVNGNFTAGLNNWDDLGDVSVFSGQGLLTTASSVNADDFPTEGTPFNFSGNDIVDIAELETFLGVDPFALDPTDSLFGAFEGSAIKQAFTVSTGSSLKFNWNFLTNEDNTNAAFANDTAFVTLVNTTNNMAQVTKLADLNSTLNACW
jgi:hypothetical protein